MVLDWTSSLSITLLGSVDRGWGEALPSMWIPLLLSSQQVHYFNLGILEFAVAWWKLEVDLWCNTHAFHPKWFVPGVQGFLFAV